MPLDRLRTFPPVVKEEKKKKKAQVINVPVEFIDIIFVGGFLKSYVIEKETSLNIIPNEEMHINYSNGDTVRVNMKNVLLYERHAGFVEKKAPEPTFDLKEKV